MSRVQGTKLLMLLLLLAASVLEHLPSTYEYDEKTVEASSVVEAISINYQSLWVLPMSYAKVPSVPDV